ncbi:MAG: rhamnulokinase [Planctomycetaceae bacterium]|nr:rhamnulokinase [Planctomycetaceae bacterium]
MSSGVVILAVDLGASSGRVLACEFTGQSFQLHEVHRFPNYGVRIGNHLMWNLPGLWQEILNGLGLAEKKFTAARIASVGVDTWGVDFALLGESQELLSLPYHYRDQQTEGALERAYQTVPAAEIYRQTGLQFMTINSLYQLLAIQARQPRLLELARHFLMIPDLFHWLLSGQLSNEITDVSTSQLYDPNHGEWANDLIQRFRLPRAMFGSLTPAGTSLGSLRGTVQQETGLAATTQVVLPGTHDTASAVVAVPVDQSPSTAPNWCYISSGTWSLMGLEVSRPIINNLTAEHNFTNEAGVGGTTRLLKNIAGLWLIQECRRIWERAGRSYSWEQMAEMARGVAPCRFFINPDDPALNAPADMPQTIRDLAARSGATPETDAEILRCAFDSLARKYSQVLQSLEQIIGRRIESIYVVGGGVHNQLLCQLTADACDRPVIAGPSEATAIGNALIQATRIGLVSDVAQARNWIAAQQPRVVYEPQHASPWKDR